MKKLFLRSGKLMYGSSLDDQSAAEVVNPEAIGFGLSAEYKTFFIDGNEHNEPEMVDLPKGWTVKYETYHCPKCGYTHEDAHRHLDHHKCSVPMPKAEKIARLIPSENAQASIKYMHDRECRRQKDEGVLCQDNCYFKTSGLKECHVKSGIVATGIPEAEQPEALAFLNEDDWTVPESGAPTYAARLACTRWLSQCLEFGWRKDQLDGLEKIWWQHHDRNGVLVKPDKAVSPPSQAESEFTELEAAQAEYIALLLMEIDSLVGIAHVHGWKSQLVELGKRCRDRVGELQKHKKP